MKENKGNNNNPFVSITTSLFVKTKSLSCYTNNNNNNNTSSSRSRRIRVIIKKTCQFIVVLFLFFLLSIRIVSYRVNHKVWMKSPLNEVERDCPLPTNYVTISSAEAATTAIVADEGKKERPNNNICITSLADGAKRDTIHHLIRWRNFDNIMTMTNPNKQSYVSKYNNYYFYDESSTSLDTSRPPSWSKIRAALRLMNEENCDWIFWLDADTVVMNSQKKIEDFLPLNNSTVHLVITEQKGKSWNAGAWLIRNNEWSINFLNTWWNLKQFIKPKGMAVSGDNDALKYLLNQMIINNHTEYTNHVAVVPRCLFNSDAKFVTESEYNTILRNGIQNYEYYNNIGRYHKNDLIAHVAGVNNKITTTQMLLKDAV